MPKSLDEANRQMKEMNARAQALIAWFESQEIGGAQATATMAYCIGVLASELTNPTEGIRSCYNLTNIVAITAGIVRPQ